MALNLRFLLQLAILALVVRDFDLVGIQPIYYTKLNFSLHTFEGCTLSDLSFLVSYFIEHKCVNFFIWDIVACQYFS